MLPSIFHVLPAELIKQIPFYLSVPELARLLHVSKRFHAFAFKATVEYFKRWGIAPPSKRDFDTSCYVFAFDVGPISPCILQGLTHISIMLVVARTTARHESLSPWFFRRV